MSYAIRFTLEKENNISEGIVLIPEEMTDKEAKKLIKKGNAYKLDEGFEAEIRKQIAEAEEEDE